MRHVLKLVYKESFDNKKTNEKMFVGILSGSDEAIAEYKTRKGAFLRLDDVTGKPKYFSNRAWGRVANLIITEKGMFVDTSDLDMRLGLAKQHGLKIDLLGDIGGDTSNDEDDSDAPVPAPF